MKQLQYELIGALVGLARSTEGNTHLITDKLNTLVIDALYGSIIDENSKRETLLSLIEQVKEAKYSLVPDCLTCTSPCGRTNDYDMKEMEYGDVEVFETKQDIIHQMQCIALIVYGNNEAFTLGFDQYFLLYKALFSIGSDWDAGELKQVIEELSEIIGPFNLI